MVDTDDLTLEQLALSAGFYSESWTVLKRRLAPDLEEEIARQVLPGQEGELVALWVWQELSRELARRSVPPDLRSWVVSRAADKARGLHGEAAHPDIPQPR
jgi:hypothetical protein